MAWKRNKGRYNIKPKSERTYKGIVYDSAFEMSYAQKLDLLLKSKKIASWERQVRYNIIVNGINIGFYKLDFLIVHLDKSFEYVDCKSTPKLVDPVYKLKKKLIEAIYGIKITEVYQKP